MSFTELLAAAKSLPRAEQLQLIDSLHESAPKKPTDEERFAEYFPPGATLDVWSPFDAFEAAGILQRLLEEERAGS